MAKGCGQEYKKQWPRDCGQKEMSTAGKRLHSRKKAVQQEKGNI
jgi:hypothetical protein